MDRRTIPISLAAIVIGVAAAFVALGLLRLIGLFTNLFYFQRWSTNLVSPAGSNLGAWAVLVPVAGAILIGLMARFGSERIRGHGIPEAIEAILTNGSRVEPRVTVLKPLSAAISIGSGGPFGAEGPIILTGGALGSLFAQFFHLSSHERKTLLVAGAAAGMSATFAAPIASVLLAVELLLFEWKPRSAIPVALASVAAVVMRRYLLGPGPLFPIPPHALVIGPGGIAAAAVLGLLVGGLSALLTLSVYAAEDAFARLPIHWMWWPAIGGLVVGLGGLIEPHALGVGYDTVGNLLQGGVATSFLLGFFAVKWIIWSTSLGSGTSGGVLAPLLLLGGALGGLAAPFLPHVGLGFWPLIGMGAILGGTMRAPFTGAIFAFELTHDVSALVPLLAASFLAHAVTVLVLRRSILTEKVARRGFHVSREYALDPLELLFVRDVMRTKVLAIRSDLSVQSIVERLHADGHGPQKLIPLVDANGRLAGVATRQELQDAARAALAGEGGERLHDLPWRSAAVATPEETLRQVVHRMAQTGVTRFPVVESNADPRLLGMVSLEDLLRARTRHLEEEQRREQVIPVSLVLPRFGGEPPQRP
jgi:H+/Cl- antiporter ClcA/predicted transcriptional regulator